MKSVLAHAASIGTVRRAGVIFAVAALTLAGLAGTATAQRGDATFYPGNRVQVLYTGGAGLNVRTGPGLGYSIIRTMPDYTTVTVQGGPVWSNGYGWYKVTGFDSRGSSGWAAGWWLFGVGSGGAGDPKPQQSSSYSSRSTHTQQASSSSSSQRSYSSSSSSSSSSYSSGRSFTVMVTGYNGAEFGSNGIMADGNHVHWGAVAVDPSVIPLGTRLKISGFGDTIFVAEDTGGAINGNHIDVWMPSVSQARAFGVQYRTVTILR